MITNPFIHRPRSRLDRRTAYAAMLAALVCLLPTRHAGAADLVTIAVFNGSNGRGPVGGLSLDAKGDIFGTTALGGFGNGSVFEIAQGSNTISTLAPNNGSGLLHSVTLDSNGNFFGTAVPNSSADGGRVFELANGSNALTTLATFNTGANLTGGVVLDANGNLFGATTSGGASGNGMVFEIAKGSNTATTLASFNGTNGGGPQAGVTIDSNGNLFGTTEGGGASNRGTVFEIAKGTNTITTLASFNSFNGEFPVTGLTLDAHGNIFGTTQFSILPNGSSGPATIFEIAQGSNTITTLASFVGSPQQLGASGLTLDANGDLFGATSFGGVNGLGSVFELASGSTTITTLASIDLSNGLGGTEPTGGVALDANGNLFGETSGGPNAAFGTVFEIAGVAAAVPEPASWLQLTIGVALLAGYEARRRRVGCAVAMR